MSEPQPTDSKFVIDVRKFVETAMNDGLRIQAIMLSQKNYEQLIELGLKLRPDLASEYLPVFAVLRVNARLS